MNGHHKNCVQILNAAVDRIEAAERLARPGSAEHSEYVKAALMNELSVIKAAARSLAHGQTDKAVHP